MPAANLHLTLRFLGNVDEIRLRTLETLLEAIQAPPFELGLDRVGAFGSGRLKRVLWLGLSTGAEPAGELAVKVEQACRGAGLEPEERPFRPHITLARARDRRGAPEPALDGAPALEPWTAPDFVLYRSRPGRGGSEYIPLRRFALDRL